MVKGTGKQHLAQQQKQTLSARLLSQISLLELPLQALEERIREEVIANPALEMLAPDEETSSRHEEGAVDDAPTNTVSEDERDEDAATKDALGDYLSEDDIPDYKLRQAEAQSATLDPFVNASSDSKSLGQLLRDQLALMDCTDRERLIAEQIIGNIGDDGYLRITLREVEDSLLFNENMECHADEIEAVLQRIQQMDPPGVGARNLQESLLLQLRRLPENEAQQHTEAILTDYFDDFANRRYERIMQALSLSEEEMLAVQKLILTLNPKPGNGIGSEYESVAERIVPDFMVHATDEGIEVWLNDGNVPKLQVSPSYRLITEEMARSERKLTVEQKYVRQQVRDAEWFITMVETRRQTLLRCMSVIVALQEDFFFSGMVDDLKPMTLKEVAEHTGHDISTISRISNEKYVQSDFGIYPIKFFFSQGSVKEDGTSVSSREVKAALQEIIDKEDKSKPYADAKLVELLAERGYPLARRTLTKYREQLGIPTARLRRKIVS